MRRVQLGRPRFIDDDDYALSTRRHAEKHSRLDNRNARLRNRGQRDRRVLGASGAVLWIRPRRGTICFRRYSLCPGAAFRTPTVSVFARIETPSRKKIKNKTAGAPDVSRVTTRFPTRSLCAPGGDVRKTAVFPRRTDLQRFRQTERRLSSRTRNPKSGFNASEQLDLHENAPLGA